MIIHTHTHVSLRMYVTFHISRLSSHQLANDLHLLFLQIERLEDSV
jgi:hypothetical protein